ncbi:aggregation factor core [Shimia haliotis]|uniref:Aggregation factor core n=1 Tax=Shimia haliotis TaxID=1280847 RepID=A0A1I4BGT3_9RHOB|nr:aggregation factor core [Shimia haliotis]SFK67500.1 hypothetical protein SAMN04488036_1011007 [Shimia haliotis]
MRIPFATVFFPTLALAVVAATHALSSVDVRFIEGAPKDRFEIRNSGACPISSATLTLDLSTSAAGLIFDVTGAGAGVEVYQPFAVTSGKASLRSLPDVRDGQNKLLLDIDTLSPGNSISFTIDVDDTTGGREITVNGSEISGATVRLATPTATNSATFNTAAGASLPHSNC